MPSLDGVAHQVTVAFKVCPATGTRTFSMENKTKVISMNIGGVIPKVSLKFCTRSESQLTIVSLRLSYLIKGCWFVG